MSAVSEGLAALRNVVLMQERLDVVRRELGDLGATVDKMNDRVLDLDRRIIRIETMIEMSGRATGQPRIEG